MAKNPQEALKTVRKSVGVGSKCHVQLHEIANALIADGYTSLDKQAKALGVHRATAWTIVKRKHKVGRLNAKTTERMLAHRDLPLRVRLIIQRYVADRITDDQ